MLHNTQLIDVDIHPHYEHSLNVGTDGLRAFTTMGVSELGIQDVEQARNYHVNPMVTRLSTLTTRIILL
ncbi:hypothetical protein AHF37_05880 [Paragonimus kellicotti]|nr:hypothetical protein AHF37_05880 [Paragonimus kellicotti]